MNRRHILPIGLILLSLGTAVDAQTPAPAASSTGADDARAAWAFFAGRFAVEAAPAAKVPPGTIWRVTPALGGKYLELQARAYEADFRITLAWDSQRRRYALSLLDSGSGAMDVYVGALLNGELVLVNDHGYRVRIQSQADGWIWQHERSKDGAWLPSGPPVQARRTTD